MTKGSYAPVWIGGLCIVDVDFNVQCFRVRQDSIELRIKYDNWPSNICREFIRG